MFFIPGSLHSVEDSGANKWKTSASRMIKNGQKEKGNSCSFPLFALRLKGSCTQSYLNMGIQFASPIRIADIY